MIDRTESLRLSKSESVAELARQLGVRGELPSPDFPDGDLWEGDGPDEKDDQVAAWLASFPRPTMTAKRLTRELVQRLALSARVLRD